MAYDSESNKASIARCREGRKPINVWIDETLVDRVHAQRKAERRTLSAWVEIVLEEVLDLRERYAPPGSRKRPQPGRAPQQGRGG